MSDPSEANQPLMNADRASARLHPEPTPLGAAPVDRIRRIDSANLFGRAAEVQIEHRGSVYRLKQTALGKLILTK